MNAAIRLSPPEWLRELAEGPKEVLWNLRGMAAGWREYPEGMDFLAPDSPNFAWKALQTRIYLEATERELAFEIAFSPLLLREWLSRS